MLLLTLVSCILVQAMGHARRRTCTPRAWRPPAAAARTPHTPLPHLDVGVHAPAHHVRGPFQLLLHHAPMVHHPAPQLAGRPAAGIAPEHKAAAAEQRGRRRRCMATTERAGTLVKWTAATPTQTPLKTASPPPIRPKRAQCQAERGGTHWAAALRRAWPPQQMATCPPPGPCQQLAEPQRATTRLVRALLPGRRKLWQLATARQAPAPLPWTPKPWQRAMWRARLAALAAWQEASGRRQTGACRCR